MRRPSSPASTLLATVIPAAALLATLVLAGGCDGGGGTARTATVGEPAPAYGARTIAGDSVDLAALEGHVVLLNIWATWCPPCREEMPSLQRLHQDLAGAGLRVVAVSVDNQGAKDAVVAFVKEYGLGFTILHDPADRVGSVFRNVGVPETYLLDREGRLVRRWIGAIDADAPAFRDAVRELL